LGFVLMHEHIIVRSEGLAQNFPHIWEPQPALDRALELLTSLKAKGVDTLVDLTVYGLGRDIPLLLPIVEKSGMQVIVATGLYTFNDLPTYFRNRTPDEIADLFIRDIEEGIQGTKIKPAIFKCATDTPGVTPGVEKVLRAVARAHLRTGLPISTHTHAASRRGLEQQDIFAAEGVDLGLVIIGHSGDSDDLDYLTKLLERGSYIGMDRFGLDSFLPEERRIDTIARLCRMGWAGRMVLSHDTMAYFDVYELKDMGLDRPNWNYFQLVTDIIPKLLKAGVTPEQIDLMTRETPRRIFENKGR
ncbi:MAG: phosphotriesterase-related protein, partial [Thermodesulfobacteriota bacterium]